MLYTTAVSLGQTFSYERGSNSIKKSLKSFIYSYEFLRTFLKIEFNFLNSLNEIEEKTAEHIYISFSATL